MRKFIQVPDFGDLLRLPALRNPKLDKHMRYPASRIAIFSTVLLLTVALSLACTKSSRLRNAPKETPPPDTVIVSTNGGGQYTTISEALKGVQPGMRILVRPGVYNEALIIDKLVEIVADARGTGEQVVLQTFSSSSITMRTDAAVVRGFVIRHRPACWAHFIIFSRSKRDLRSTFLKESCYSKTATSLQTRSPGSRFMDQQLTR